jgi:hypothetical protein
MTLKRKMGEEALSIEVAMRLKILEKRNRLTGMWFHVPNEMPVQNKLDLTRLAKKRAMGMMAGAPDLVFLKKDGCLQIELKYGKNSLSSNQKEYRDMSEKKEAPYVICKSWDDVSSELTKYGFLG